MNLTQVVDSTLSSFRSEVSDYLGSALVDLSTGMLLDADTVAEAPGDVLDVLAAAVAEMFQGRVLGQVQEVWSRHGVDVSGSLWFREIVVSGDEIVTVMLRSRENPELVAAVVCRREANLGMLLAQARRAVRGLDER